jgi:preprotein translocase subunit SecD
MHLTLEVDESKQAVADKSEALDRALKVVRQRIDEFGVAEPVVQKVGTDRIIVELPGIDDAERAQDVVQKSAFLEFQITDESGALDKAMPSRSRAACSPRTSSPVRFPASTSCRKRRSPPSSARCSFPPSRRPCRRAR